MDLQELQVKVVPILKKYSVIKAAVFGSYARGTADENSDVDLLIEYCPQAKATLFTHWHLQEELEAVLQVKVDLVTKNALAVQPDILIALSLE
jgi:predicted nucleotidyltransferase